MTFVIRLVIGLVMVAVVTMAQKETDAEMAARIAFENENARYSFYTNVEDQISDLTQSREEVRQGLNVKGQYSYSDGFYKRTVVYEADHNGYRVLEEKVETLNGPNLDPAGTASVQTRLQDGSLVNYRIQRIPDNK